MRWHCKFIFLLSVVSADAAYVVTNTGRQINGTEIAAAADGAVTLKTESGQTMTFRKGQFRSAIADRPAALDQASALMNNGKHDAAVALLNEVKVRYRSLAWDQAAIHRLADYYFASEAYTLAIREYELLLEKGPSVQEKIREAMMKSGDTSSLITALDQDISSGSRKDAAEAYLMRGSLKAERDDMDGARRDWLKVVLFFKGQAETVLQAEERLADLE